MKSDVGYQLDLGLRAEIKQVKNTICSVLRNSEVYLFGSIAKGKYSQNSDIDILVLIDSQNSLKELREIRHSLEDKIELLRLKRDVDIKLYTKSRFNDISTTLSFENVILKDLVDLKEW